MASTFAGNLTQLGSSGVRFSEQIEVISGGNIKVKFFDPGALVPALEIFDAVSSGSIDAGWSTPGYWAGKVPALPLLQLFHSVLLRKNIYLGFIMEEVKNYLKKFMLNTISKE